MDVVAGDTAPDAIARAIGKVENRLRSVSAKFGFNLSHGPAQARDELPAIAARRAKADCLCLQQNNIKPLFCASKCCREAGKATANDDNIAGEIALRGFGRWCQVGRGGIIAVVQRVGHIRRGATNAHAPKN